MTERSENLGKDRLIWMYRQMVRIREFEERVKRTFVEHPGVIRGHTHLADGAEASIVGSLATRQRKRSGNAQLSLPRLSRSCSAHPSQNDGGDLRPQATDSAKASAARCIWPIPPIISPALRASSGRAIAHATGAALTAQVKGPGQMVYCFFGDGSAKQGAFYESLNLAAVWKLPIVYVLENNEYQAYTHISLEDANYIAGDPLSQKAKAFSIPGVTVDGTDPLKVYDEVAKAVERARNGEGPSLIESKFYRFSAHGNAITVPPVPTQFPEHEVDRACMDASEPNSRRPGQRSDHEVPRETDCQGNASAKPTPQRIEEEARTEMDDAVRFALASPLPAPEEAAESRLRIGGIRWRAK